MAFTESDVYNNESFLEQYMQRRYREIVQTNPLKNQHSFSSLVM